MGIRGQCSVVHGRIRPVAYLPIGLYGVCVGSNLAEEDHCRHVHMSNAHAIFLKPVYLEILS
jgi:hypothetical protein